MTLDFERKSVEEKRGNHDSRSERPVEGNKIVAGMGGQSELIRRASTKHFSAKGLRQIMPPNFGVRVQYARGKWDSLEVDRRGVGKRVEIRGGLFSFGSSERSAASASATETLSGFSPV